MPDDYRSTTDRGVGPYVYVLLAKYPRPCACLRSYACLELINSCSGTVELKIMIGDLGHAYDQLQLQLEISLLAMAGARGRNCGVNLQCNIARPQVGYFLF